MVQKQQVADVQEMLPLNSEKKAASENSNSSSDGHQYDLKSLDKIWAPSLLPKLTPKDQIDGGGTALETSEDVIDARGTITFDSLIEHLQSMHRSDLENQLGISWSKVTEIVRRADIDSDGIIHYKDLLETVQNYRMNTEQASTLKSIFKAFAYAEEFSCTPIKWFIPTISILETIVFVYHCIHLTNQHDQVIGLHGPAPICSAFIYNPHRRYQIWRYVTYMFVHIGLLHYVFNMIMQMLVGVFLEMEQEGWKGSFRVMAVYFSGVLAGSLGTTVADPETYIGGASGGIYALISAHLATMIMNWKEDNAVKIRKVIHRPVTKFVRIIFISLLTLHDFSIGIYEYYVLKEVSTTGYIGHLCGAISGILVGLCVLQNRKVDSWEPIVQWICLSLFGLFVFIGIIYNCVSDAYPETYYETSHECAELMYF